MGIQERLGVKTWGERLRGQESEDWRIDIGYRKQALGVGFISRKKKKDRQSF